jgi:hypothetical protein
LILAAVDDAIVWSRPFATAFGANNERWRNGALMTVTPGRHPDEAPKKSCHTAPN